MTWEGGIGGGRGSKCEIWIGYNSTTLEAINKHFTKEEMSKTQYGI